VGPTLHTGITAEVAVLRDLLNGSVDDLQKSLHKQPDSSQ
jgi:hypothetical protein